MYGPAINDTPVDGALGLCSGVTLQSVAPLPQLVHATASSRARILRVLGECDSSAALAATETILQHLLVHVFGEGVRVSECDIRLVRRSLWGDLVKDFAHLGALIFGPLADGRTTANGIVLLLNLGGTARRDQGTEVVLESAEWDEIAVRLSQRRISKKTEASQG